MCNWRVLPAVMLVVSSFPCFAQSASPQGIIEPIQDARVSASASGIVVSIRASEGQRVSRGEAVVELDSDLEALEVERRKTIADSTVEIDAARRRLETLQVDLEGTRTLSRTTRSVSPEDLRKKELEYLLAEADLAQLEVAKKREILEYRIADTQLRKRTVVAPFDGVIVQRLLDVGESCTLQQPLFRIVDVSRCRLVVHLEKGLSMRLKPGKQVAVRVQEADGPVSVAGAVEFVSPLVDASSGLREVKVLIENPDGRIHPGVTASILLDR